MWSIGYWLIATGLLIPVLEIVFGVGYSITARVTRHRERMAMIERGMDPGQEATDARREA